MLMLSTAHIWAIEETRNIGDLRFIENKGQWEYPVLYKAEVQQGVVFLENNTFTFVVFQKASHKKHSAPETTDPHGHGTLNTQKAHAYKMKFLGEPKNNIIQGENPYPDYYNYFLGNDTSRWASKVSAYSAVQYQEIFPDIDMKVYSKADLMKYDLIVKPNARTESIQIQYEGTDGLRLNNNELYVYTSVGEIIELKPYAYQIINGETVEVECRYTLRNNIVGFSLGAYDREKELIIDPTLVFSTYTGSTADNWGFTATYDSKENAFAGGIAENTLNRDYPVSMGAFQLKNAGNWDMAIIKYNPTGTQRIYATYLGGSKGDIPNSLMVNEFDELLILGTTGSDDYPVTPNAYSKVFHGGAGLTYDNVVNFSNGTDIVVSKLSADGSQLLASTFIGGTENDGLNFHKNYNLMLGNDSLYYNYGDGARGELITDDLNNVYVGSCTFSVDFPVTSNAFQPKNNGMQDGVVFKLDYNLTTLLWSSYLGGKNNDAIFSIDVDSKYDLYVTGGTSSVNFPTTFNAYRTSYQGGSADAFVSKISKNGSKLLASTFFGSDKYDQGYFVRSNQNDDIFITGQTKASGTTLIQNALYNTPNSGQFIAKFKPNLQGIYWSTVYGTGNGKPNISPSAFSVDVCNRIYITGWGRLFNPWYYPSEGTHSMQTTPDAYQKNTDGQDFYLMILQPEATGLLYATFFGELHDNMNPSSGGGDHVDGGTSRFDKKGSIYQSVCASCGKTQKFPTYPSDAYSSYNGSDNCNNALFKFNFATDFALADFTTPPINCAPATINFENTSLGTTFQWDFGDGSPLSTDKNPSHTYTQRGRYKVTLIANVVEGCILTDTLIKYVLVLGNKIDTLPNVAACKGEPTQIGIPPINDPNVTYQWIPSTGLSDVTISNPFTLLTNSIWYSLIVSNGSCTDTLKQYVNVYDLSQINIPDTILCQNKIRLNDLLPPDSNLTYIWSNNPNFTSIINGNQAYSIEKTEIFYVKISLDDCEAIDSVKISLLFKDCDVEISNISCYGKTDGSIKLIPQSIPPYTYLWNDGNTSSERTGLGEGTYKVTITNGDGCVYVNTFTITEPDSLLYAKEVENCVCNEVCSGNIKLFPAGGTTPYSYAWSNGVQTFENKDLCPGIYTAEITDKNGCKLYDTTQIIVDDIFDNVKVWADKDSILLGLTTTLHATPIAGMSYEWWDASTLSTPYASSTVAKPTETTTYYVRIKHPSGCEKILEITIYVEFILCGDPFVFVPNAFTPNGDKENDEVYVRSLFVDYLEFSIYDRWGEKVFETKDINQGWDGTYRNQQCQSGVYMYQLNVRCLDGKTFKKKGDITLIR